MFCDNTPLGRSKDLLNRWTMTKCQLRFSFYIAESEPFQYGLGILRSPNHFELGGRRQCSSHDGSKGGDRVHAVLFWCLHHRWVSAFAMPPDVCSGLHF